MANRKVTKDVSDALISAAVIASYWGEKTQRLIETHASDKTKVTVNKGGYYIPLLIGDSFFLHMCLRIEIFTIIGSGCCLLTVS